MVLSLRLVPLSFLSLSLLNIHPPFSLLSLFYHSPFKFLSFNSSLPLPLPLPLPPGRSFTSQLILREKNIPQLQKLTDAIHSEGLSPLPSSSLPLLPSPFISLSLLPPPFIFLSVSPLSSSSSRLSCWYSDHPCWLFREKISFRWEEGERGERWERGGRRRGREERVGLQNNQEYRH